MAEPPRVVIGQPAFDRDDVLAGDRQPSAAARRRKPAGDARARSKTMLRKSASEPLGSAQLTRRRDLHFYRPAADDLGRSELGRLPRHGLAGWRTWPTWSLSIWGNRAKTTWRLPGLQVDQPLVDRRRGQRGADSGSIFRAIAREQSLAAAGRRFWSMASGSPTSGSIAGRQADDRGGDASV